jgi:hypothetical protein
VNPGVIAHLLNRIGEFSEWGLIAVLDLVSRYTPSSEEEMFGVMNLLDPVLRYIYIYIYIYIYVYI